MSLSPPPRKPSVSSPQRSSSARYPKINTNALLAAHAPIDETDDQDVEKDLANFFASTSLSAPTSSSTSPTSLPDRNHYPRPSSIATVFSPIDPSNSSWSSKTSPQPCPLGHHRHLHHDVDNNLNGGHDQDMAMAGPMLPSCSYCSSVRSNSISSVMEETHSSQVRERNNSTSQSYENQRRDKLRELVPDVVRHRLTFHLDECWFVHFSPSAQYLASAGLDFSVILWQDIMVILSTYTLFPFLFSFCTEFVGSTITATAAPILGLGLSFLLGFRILVCLSFPSHFSRLFHCYLCSFTFWCTRLSVCGKKRPMCGVKLSTAQNDVRGMKNK